MIPVRIETLIIGMMPSPAIVVLRPFVAAPTASGEGASVDMDTSRMGEVDASRVLPIWVGPVEAMAIGMALESISNDNPRPSRPATHDLLGSLLTSVGGRIDHIEITRMEGTTFFANIVVDKEDATDANRKPIYVDARPSDAIAIALRNQVPMFVADDVMKNASFPAILAAGVRTATPEQIESQMSEFKDFVSDITPDDFSA